MMAFLLGKDREFILTHPEFIISKNVYKKFKALEKKRLSGWSIAVLIGHKEFYGLDFHVNKNVLVPRPETEMMVDKVINLIGGQEPGNKDKEITTNKTMVIDLGTGTGAIIISSAHEIKRISPNLYKKTIFRAVDISAAALNIAKKNAILNKQAKKIKFRHGNLLEPMINKKDFKEFTGQKLIIAANLPYLTPSQIKNSPSIKKEPRIALEAGKDGLKYYRELFRQIKSLKKIFGLDRWSARPIIILCEIDSSQARKIKLTAKKYFPAAAVEIKKDLAGKNRLAIIKIPD